jgi:hypothetical protein
VVFVLSYFFPPMYNIGTIILVLLAIVVAIDVLLLYSKQKGLYAVRITSDRYSNSDENRVELKLHNYYPFPVHANIIDELPVQFQQRDRTWRKHKIRVFVKTHIAR